MKTIYVSLLLMIPLLLAAADQDVPLPPPLTEQPAAQFEPQVTIRKEKTQTVREYRLNGVLYMIAITPKNAPTYYLIDTDGDGELETTRNELDPNIMIPSWTIFRW